MSNMLVRMNEIITELEDISAEIAVTINDSLSKDIDVDKIAESLKAGKPEIPKSAMSDNDKIRISVLSDRRDVLKRELNTIMCTAVIAMGKSFRQEEVRLIEKNKKFFPDDNKNSN